MLAVTTWNSRSRPLPLGSVCSCATSDFFSFFCGWPFFVASAFRFEAVLGEDGDILWRVERSESKHLSKFLEGGITCPTISTSDGSSRYLSSTLRRQNGMFHHTQDGIPGLMNPSRPLESLYRSFCRAPEPWAERSTRPADKPRRVRHRVSSSTVQ